MAVQLNINELTFGSDDAELDEKHGFLSKVFLKTAIYHRVRKSVRELIIGRKGAGKSAICLMLKNALESEGVTTILVTPDSLSQHKIEQLKTSSINKDETYVLSWEYILLITVAKEVVRHSKKIKSGEAKKKLKSVRTFLVNNDEIDKTFFDKISKKATALSKFSVKAYGIEGAVETRQLEIQRDAANELTEFRNTLIGLLAELDNLQVILLIDKVDDIWNQTEEAEFMIIGLLKAVHTLNASLHNSHIIVFLRSDIYDILKFNDADKLHSLEERLVWQDSDLKHLIATRGKVSAELKETDIDILWNTIFDGPVSETQSFEYIVARTLKRPRDLIQFCNNALTEAQDNNHNKITTDDILEAEKQYSNWKLKDLASEYAIQYPYLDELLGLFQAFKSEFSREEFNARYQEAQKRLAKYPDLKETNSDKMLQILFIIGFLGTYKSNKAVFSYDDPLILLPQHNKLIVHPAFHLALGLQKLSTHITQISDRISGPINTGSGDIVVGDINVVGDIAARDIVTGIHIESVESSNRELQSLYNRLDLHRDNLKRLQLQQAKYSQLNMPLHLMNQIEDEEAQIDTITTKINQLKEQLTRDTLRVFTPQQSTDLENDRERRIEHDKKIFIESNKILNERELSDILDRLFGDHSIWMSDVSKINQLGKFLEEESNQYLTPVLQTETASLTDNLSRLSLFSGKNFFVFPENQTSENFRLCMHPGCNIDRGFPSEEQSKFYGKCTNELNEIIEELDKRYKNYRKAIKKALYV